MGYEILATGQIMCIEEVITNTQTATVKSHRGMEKRIIAEAQKTSLSLAESLEIVFKWQKFNLENGIYEDNPTNSDIIKIDVAGTKDELQPINGQESIIFSSAEPGTYSIKTETPVVDNSYLEVTVNA